MSATELRTVATLPEDARQLLEQAVERFSLSARSTHRLLRTSRTIADLADSEQIEVRI
ncbi:MAG: hypothetical protein ACK48R_15815 [Planctomyces sp.]